MCLCIYSFASATSAKRDSRLSLKNASLLIRSLTSWSSTLNLMLQVSYSGLRLYIESDNSEIDKKTVLDLCAHMFHPKDQSNDVSGTMEYNELKQEERIKEFENA